MEIKFDAGKRLYTNAIRHRFVQGENMAESITITGPKQVGALDLSQLRMAVRVNSLAYETTVEKTLSQTVQGETISLEWVVDKMFTAVPGPVSVTLVGYGNEEEVIKITSDGILVKADDVEQLLAEMQQFATETYQNAQAAAASEANAKASEAAAQKAAEQATNAAETASEDAAAATEEKITQFADDRYARALKATDGPAEQLTIYPDEGSSLQIMVHGATVQEGSGDPSPNNVRPLTGVGRKMCRYVVTGQEAWQVQTTQHGNYRMQLRGALLPAMPAVPSSSGVQADIFSNLYLPVTGAATYAEYIGVAVAVDASVYVYNPAYNTNDVAPWKQHLQALYAAGTPLVLYYVPSDESQATGWYTYAAVDGDTYAAVGLPLNGPLYDGDKVSNDAPSGRDLTVVFDQDQRIGIQSINSAGVVNVQHTPGGEMEAYTAVSDWLPYDGNAIATAKSAGVHNNADVVYVRILEKTLEPYGHTKGNTETALTAAKAFFAENPVVVFAKSANYAPEKGVRAETETHERVFFEFDGSADEAWQSESVTSGVRFYISLPLFVKNSDKTNGSTSDCNWLQLAQNGGTYTIENTYTIASNVNFFVRIAGVSTIEQLRQTLEQKPLQVLATLATPAVYAHPRQPLIAAPDADGKITVTGEGQASVNYNKSITRAIAELQAAALAMGANLSI